MNIDDDRLALDADTDDDSVVIHGTTWRTAVDEERDWLVEHRPAARPVARFMKGLPDGRVLDVVLVEVDGAITSITFDVTRAFPDFTPPSDVELAMLPTVEPS